MTTTTPDTGTRALLQRDITEALLRLRLARCQRDRKEIEVCEKRLDWLLDRFAAHMRVEEDS
jgi:hypothetical protein